MNVNFVPLWAKIPGKKKCKAGTRSRVSTKLTGEVGRKIMREDKGRGIEGSVLKYGTDKEKDKFPGDCY